MACVCVRGNGESLIAQWIVQDFGVIFLALYQKSTRLSWRVWQPISTSSRYEMQWCFAHRAVGSARLWMILSENSIIVDSLALYQEKTDLSWRVRQVNSDVEQVCDERYFAENALSSASVSMIVSENWIIVDFSALLTCSTSHFVINKVCDAVLFWSQCCQSCKFMENSQKIKSLSIV